MLAKLLGTAMNITYGATTGKFADVKGTMKTYKMPNAGKNKVFRASHIADTCEHTIVRNLRQWLIAIPKAQQADHIASQDTDTSNSENSAKAQALSTEDQCTAGV